MPLVEEVSPNKSATSESPSKMDVDDVEETKDKRSVTTFLLTLDEIDYFLLFLFSKSIKEKQRKGKRTSSKIEVKGWCERTFITFDNDIDDSLFSTYFPKPLKRERRSQICAITRLPARYYDPVTQLPYRNLQAFKILREAYYQQLEDRGNPDNPAVSKWLEWRKKIKEFRLKSVNKNSSLLGMISSTGNTQT